MSYGTVISGGARMTKGLTKGINDKLEGHKAENDRRSKVAAAVEKVYKVRTLSDQSTNNVKGGKFEKPSVPSKV
jgi:hypothetical protein